MTSDATEAVRTQARADCEALLAQQPWLDVATRALVLLVRPPALAWASPLGTPALWMVIDASEARSLTPQYRDPLITGGSYHETAGRGRYELTVFTSEGIGRVLEGVPRNSLEIRWTVRHAEPLHDPLHRGDSLSSAAARLPSDALERVVRPLYVQAASALHALMRTPVEGPPETTLVLAGEAAGALARLGCVLAEGSHPPAEYLMPAARETPLGQRIASWLDDLGNAVVGEARAARWVRESCTGVLREAETTLRAEYSGREWLEDPEGYALRPGR
ncbi:MAG: hypothetical protein WCL53_00835 [Chloroflexota bacterium]